MRTFPDNRYTRLVTWILRIVVGATFVFSGFVKSIDPWGTIYKMGDYLAAMHLDIWPTLVVSGVFILCAYEFLTGVFLLLGSFRKSSPIMAAVMMAFMLPLTLWIAIADPVADCGCFGDALIISNWATFFKNVALSLAIVWLLIYNKRSGWLVTPALQWLEFSVCLIYVFIIGMHGYLKQPLIDFRDYKIGGPIVELNPATGDEDPEFVFVYEKNGVKKDFSETDELPDEADGWVFVERKESVPEKSDAGNKSKESDAETGRNFRIWSEDGNDDITSEVVRPGDKDLFVLIPDMDNVSISTSWVLNSLYDWAQKNNINFITVIAGSSQSIAKWEDLAMPQYPIYRSDDTSIKEIARGNPALVYVDNNEIVWKNSLYALNIDDFMSNDVSNDPKSFAPQNKRIVCRLTGILLSVLAVLIALSFTTKFPFRSVFRRKKKSPDSSKPDSSKIGEGEPTHDDKAHSSE